jgi:hypothetical protein
MLPRRKLSEVITLAKLGAKHCHLLVEGRSDYEILRSFCEGENIPTHIYPAEAIDFEACRIGPNGYKGKLQRASRQLQKNNAQRLFCVIDRDDFSHSAFDYNSHCMITDYASLELYALDVKSLCQYVSRFFLVDLTAELFEALFRVAQLATAIQWAKEKIQVGLRLADINNSLRMEDGAVVLDIKHWAERSRSMGGTASQWRLILEEVKTSVLAIGSDFYRTTSIHRLDEVFAFWIKAVKGKPLVNWLEQHLRGVASHEALKDFAFFRALSARCLAELG